MDESPILPAKIGATAGTVFVGAFGGQHRVRGKIPAHDPRGHLHGREGAIIVHSVPSAPVTRERRRLSGANTSGGNIFGRWDHSYSGRSDTSLQFYFDRYIRTGRQVRETRDTLDFDFPAPHRLGAVKTWSGALDIAERGIDGGTIDEAFFPPAGTSPQRLVRAFLQDEIALRPDRLFLYVGTKLETQLFLRL